MAVRPIRNLPDPVLRRRTRRVNDIDADLQRLIDDMIDTMRDAGGVGLAANQVGASPRVCVIEIPPEEEDGESRLLVLINPQVITRRGERELDEGCLSIPGYRGTVNRSVEVRVRALDRAGNPVRVKAVDNLLAQALEHEIDHLNGILYIDHLVSRNAMWKLSDEHASGASEAAVGASSD